MTQMNVFLYSTTDIVEKAYSGQNPEQIGGFP